VVAEWGYYGMKPYSPDLRSKIVDAVDSGLPHQEVADRFGVSVDSVSRYVKQQRELGHLYPRPIPGARPRISPDDYPALMTQLQAHPDATLEEHCTVWAAAGHRGISPATMCRTQQRLGWTRKKRP
jgi:transposase